MTWLAILRGLAVTDAKHIARDRFLAFILAYAIALAVVVRYAVPWLTAFLSARHGVDITPYYGLLSSFVALTIGTLMVGIVLGFLLLEARETRVIDALAVSPLTFDRFLHYRVAMPMAFAVVLNPLCAWIGGVGLPAPGPALVIAVCGTLFAGLGTLALATFSDNKVQAFAVMKILSGVGMLPMAAYFVDEPAQYLFGLFPPYWLFKAWWVAVDGGTSWWIYASVGAASNLALLAWMKRRFARAVHQGAPTSS